MRPTYFRLEYGTEEQHAAELSAGLLMLGSDFNARVCSICKGHGKYNQRYTAGCGGGYFTSSGDCDYCKRLGLLQGDGAASLSVVYQVLAAGKVFLGTCK